MDEEFDLEAKRRSQESYLNSLEAIKTDSSQVAQTIDQYDFDASAVNEYNTICKQFQDLKQEFIALKRVTAMRFEKNG